MATDNPRWGDRRIRGDVLKLGHRVAHSTVCEILHAAGIDRAPRLGGYRRRCGTSMPLREQCPVPL
jgi:hypothetical protein